MIVHLRRASVSQSLPSSFLEVSDFYPNYPYYAFAVYNK